MPGDAPRVLVVQHEPGAPVALLGQWLVDAGASLDVRRPDLGEVLPDSLDDHDALLVLGGSMGAHDDATCAWLPATKDLIRTAAAGSVPTLGVCLGHQLVAVALGGRSEPNPAGQQLGLLPLGWTPAVHEDPLLAPVAAAGAARGLHWNDDVVVRHPAGTVVLALAPGGELQAARFAPTVWGVQLHPEVDEAVVRGWHEEDADRHAPGIAETAVGALADARVELERSWRPLADSLVALARSVRAGRDQLSRGVVD